MSDQQKTPASIEVDAARLKAGGDIRSAYSGEIIMTTPADGVAEIPQPFSEGERLYTTTSIVVGVGGTAYALTPITGPEDGAPEGRARDSYEHRVVRHGEQHYRLTAPPLRLMAGGEQPSVAPRPAAPEPPRPRQPAPPTPEPPQPGPVGHAAQAEQSAAPETHPTPPGRDTTKAEAGQPPADGEAVEATPPEEAVAAPAESHDEARGGQPPDAGPEDDAETFPEADAAAAGAEHDAPDADAPQEPAAAATPKEEPAPPPRPRSYEWDQATIRVILTLRRDDGGPDGRPALIAVQNHDDTALFSSARLKLSELPPPVAAALERLREDMPNRAAAHEARLEAAREAEERRKEKELAQKIKSASRAKKSASRPSASQPPGRPSPAFAAAPEVEPEEDADGEGEFDDVSVVSDDSSPAETAATAPAPTPGKTTPSRAHATPESAQPSLFG